MVAYTVAVAGGTGGIGCTIVEELVRQGKHKVLILGREVYFHDGICWQDFVITN